MNNRYSYIRSLRIIRITSKPNEYRSSPAHYEKNIFRYLVELDFLQQMSVMGAKSLSDILTDFNFMVSDVYI